MGRKQKKDFIGAVIDDTLGGIFGALAKGPGRSRSTPKRTSSTPRPPSRPRRNYDSCNDGPTWRSTYSSPSYPSSPSCGSSPSTSTTRPTSTGSLGKWAVGVVLLIAVAVVWYISSQSGPQQAQVQSPAAFATPQTQDVPAPQPVLPPVQSPAPEIASARQLFESRDYKAAAEAADRALLIDPSNPETLQLRGQIMRTMEILGAEDNPQTTPAGAAGPDRSALAADLLEAGRLYRDRDYKDALATCDRALRSDPGNEGATQLRNSIVQTMAILGLQ